MVKMYIILYFNMLLAYFIIFVHYIAMHFFTFTLVVIERRNPTMRSLHNPDIANLINNPLPGMTLCLNNANKPNNDLN